MVSEKKLYHCTKVSYSNWLFLRPWGIYATLEDNVIYGLFLIFQKMSLNVDSLLHSDSAVVIKEL